jgi:PIN domain nuclease of toxin-antitoxin system
MDILLDTHALIWFITDDSKLPVKSKQIIENSQNTCYISIATFWEIGIKISLGRLNLNTDLKTIFEIIENTGFEVLPITLNHILKGAGLEFFHQDPFDRIIIAQAIFENFTIISKDQYFNKYPVTLFWK